MSNTEGSIVSGLSEGAPSDTAAQVAAAAAERGVLAHVVDGSSVTTKAAALDAFAAAMSFPSWFGRNLDALYDCLTDLSWLPAGEQLLIWSHVDRLRDADPEAYRNIRAVLAAAAVADLGESTLDIVLTTA